MAQVEAHYQVGMTIDRRFEHQFVARVGELGTPQIVHFDRLGDPR